MDKFKFSQLVDYFIKVNKGGTPISDLSQEDMMSLAILSIFDKGGQTVKTSNYSYERPNDLIDENEFNLTKAEYEKAAKQIQKAIKKEVGKEFSPLNMPSYEDLQAMMKDDKKIDFEELHLYAREGVIKPANAKKVEFHGLPALAETNVTLQDKKDFVQKVADNDAEWAIIEKFNNMSDAEFNKYVKLAQSYDATFKDVQSYINEFEPDKNVSFNKQEGLNGEQFNDKGQKIFRIHGNAGVYESFKYDSDKSDAKFTQMMRYNPNGYKTEFWEMAGEPTDNPVRYTVYSLDENEKITAVNIVPESVSNDQELQDYNDFKFFDKYSKYYDEVFSEDVNPKVSDSTTEVKQEIKSIEDLEKSFYSEISKKGQEQKLENSNSKAYVVNNNDGTTTTYYDSGNTGSINMAVVRDKNGEQKELIQYGYTRRTYEDGTVQFLRKEEHELWNNGKHVSSVNINYHDGKEIEREAFEYTENGTSKNYSYYENGKLVKRVESSFYDKDEIFEGSIDLEKEERIYDANNQLKTIVTYSYPKDKDGNIVANVETIKNVQTGEVKTVRYDKDNPKVLHGTVGF